MARVLAVRAVDRREGEVADARREQSRAGLLLAGQPDLRRRSPARARGSRRRSSSSARGRARDSRPPRSRRAGTASSSSFSSWSPTTSGLRSRSQSSRRSSRARRPLMFQVAMRMPHRNLLAALRRRVPSCARPPRESIHARVAAQRRSAAAGAARPSLRRSLRAERRLRARRSRRSPPRRATRSSSPP